MSKQDEASLILKLYELRREDTMRKARDWFTLEFNPASMDDLNNYMFSEHSGHLRMVLSYWEMAAALVNQGAISLEMFNETNGEHLGVFSKIEHLVPEVRAVWGPQWMANLEKVIDSTPKGRERIAIMRERMKGILAELAERRSRAATQS